MITSVEVKEFIFSKDGLIRSAKVQLSNHNVISRAINHLFPLEILSVVKTDKEFSLGDNSFITDESRPSCNSSSRENF